MIVFGLPQIGKVAISIPQGIPFHGLHESSVVETFRLQLGSAGPSVNGVI